MSIVINILMVLLVALCLLMLLIILMQRPKQEGLGAAFGGGMMDGMLGSGTTNFLQKGTVYLTVGYFVLTMALDVIQARTSEARSQQGRNLEVPAAATSPEEDPEAVAPGAIDAPETRAGTTDITPKPFDPSIDPAPTPAPGDDAEAAIPVEGDLDASAPESSTGDEGPAAPEAEEAPEVDTPN
ncbi:MAG: preprotein translocase subunit SecG [Verrucomicrobia bacterium]|nr:preprotein translocase subunit SecG [Verrucomicrobiota bacterium]